jgi:VWFA-related protein
MATRTFAFSLMLLAATASVFAARPITIDQLRQQLAAVAGKPDKDAAFQIAGLELAERLSWARESDLEKLVPGEKSRQALRAIADESQFREPPASEIPQQPAPDIATQRAIMSRVVNYVAKTIPQLPNFLATRVTEQYEDTPLLVSSQQAQMIPYEPMHFLSAQTLQVTYQDGHEMLGGVKKAGAPQATANGLITLGVFGPILGRVLVDVSKGQMKWARWEQGEGGARAVFSYAVPKPESHYEVTYCCVAEQAGSLAANVHLFQKLEGYHGEMAVDPESGIIEWVTLEAEMKVDDPVVKANLLVVYGPVEIGGRMYTCPVRSVSSLRAQSVQVDPNFHYELAHQLQPLKNELADVTYKDYHVFRGETRVLTAAEAAQAEKASPVQPNLPAQQAAAGAPGVAPVSSAAAPSTAAAAASTTAENAAQAASYQPLLQQRPAQPATPIDAGPPEMSATDANSLPEQAAAQAPIPNTGFTLRRTTRLVEVAVVATDKKGHPITDLKPEDLEIFDNGRAQAVKDFAQAGADVLRAAPASQQAATATEPVATNRPIANSAAARRESGNTTVLLIDAGHVAFSDLTYAREEILRFLKTVPEDESVGLYILNSHGFQVIDEPTLDHASLAGTLAKWMPSSQDLLHAQEEESRNHQQFDWVHSIQDLQYVNGNGEGGSDPSMFTSGKGVAPAFTHPPDAELRPMGDRPEDFALHLLLGVGRHLAAIPGHKTLVWIASDNVLADWASSMVGQEDNGNRFLDQVSLSARETLNEAHVSIYPLDVSQLEGGGISASLANKDVTPIGKSSRDIALASMGDMAPGNKNGRDTARMNEDTHPIQPEFRELAEATGGRALRRAGDIAGELGSIVADGRAAYLLSFSPDTQADGKYHTITMKCLRKDVKLRYRNGYFYSEEAATMKERFREAVWQPRDETEIGLTAEMVREPIGNGVRLNIAATDLEMAEQDGRWTDKVDVFLVVRDDSGLHASIAGKRLGLALKPATYQQKMKDGLTVEEALPKLPVGPLVRLIVIDENSRRMGTVTVNSGQ